MGYIHPQGHGSLRVINKGANTNFKARQLSLRLHGMDIPDGHDIHHVYENRWCVNPDHLELIAHGAHRRLHLGDCCPQGHPKTSENLYHYKGRPYGCLICRNERSKARKVVV